MESLTSQIKRLSVSGTQRTQHPLEHTPTTLSLSSQTSAIPSPIDSPHGEANKSQGFVSRPLPAAEELAVAKPPKPRVLTMTSEEFYQWRQVLGQYQNAIRTALDSNVP
jgi:hypothetical protein